MKCASCQFENREGAKFCKQCGNRLELTCPGCGSVYTPGNKFCDECGCDLRKPEPAAPREDLPPEPETAKPSAEEAIHPSIRIEGERKYVTALFSDMSGYTAMSEKLDPEEVKGITSRIFGKISQIIANYDGFIEKFVGDAVMALFGVPKVHEDDPVRAIKAAREIHDLVQAISPELEDKIGKPLSMHTGINTGLVVTGNVSLEKGTHGVAGDTINVAARLSSLASPGEIVVGPETYRQAAGYFAFESLEPTKVKGKAKPIQIYRLLSPKEEPITIHRLHGMRADLIGRKVEMDQLGEAVQRLRQGKGGVFSICGDAGTGKSRLVEEFKATLDLKEIQWREGHAYAYSQNIPYFPLIDLLNRAWKIEEGDPPEEIRTKIELGTADLIREREDIVPYVGSLYSLSYPEIEGVSPEFWKSRLQEAIQAILAALAHRAPTVICLEDIHWADPSFLDLFRFLLSEFTYPALFLCVYRPPFSLLKSHQLSSMGELYREIRLQDLSSAEAQDMLESLLKTKSIPSELRRFTQEKVEGNPFYVEEVINALIESGTLARDNGTWKLTRSIREADIPSTIHGVISARLDRLEKESKRILQEASVIGKAFLYEILKKITELREQIDHCLSGLERLDLIRARSLDPELEYVFKHALTQEVVYSGLLKKERQGIHERIALVMEQLFQDRLPEFYETLAFHFKKGQSLHKAIDYLVKSGEKSLRRYAVEESHQYFKEAFDLLANKPDKSKEEKAILIDLLIKWSLVFYYRGDFRELVDLFSAHEGVAESLDDKQRLGMFYTWLGMGLYCREKFRDSYQYLSEALKIGEETGNQQVIGYACAWLTWTCAALGLLDEAITFGERGREIYSLTESDPYLYFKSLGGLGYAYWHRGERKKGLEVGKTILDYGQGHSNIRSMVMGHWSIGFSHLVAGDFPSATESFKSAVQISADPFYSQTPRSLLGGSLAFGGQFQEAEDALKEVVAYSEKFGAEIIGTAAHMYLGMVSIAKGHMSQGLKMLEEVSQACLENHRRGFYALTEYVLGKVYLQIVEAAAPISLSMMAKNIGFMAKNVPFASKKAEDHFHKAIDVAKEIGAKGTLGMAYLDLGVLYRKKGKKDKAQECISMAIQFFEQCEAEVYLRGAKQALEDLG
jgi:class 3 adenylate cyclase/tetratricopeptide (TPR) repeat protein